MMNKRKDPAVLPSSFRDPDGFLFLQNGILYRQINYSYKENYDYLMSSNLYEKLLNKYLIIPHKEIILKKTNRKTTAYKIIQPDIVPFISYPYEWCFSELKDAALATLKIQKTAIDNNMLLKDSSAFNIQFYNGLPIHIDSLSFEIYKEGSPWVAYSQFCRHFLAPLALMTYNDIRLNQLGKDYLDGILLDMASSLMPFISKLNFGLLTHIHMHAAAQKKYSDKLKKISDVKTFSKTAMYALIDNLESTINNLKLKNKKTEWSDYKKNNNYSIDAIEDKKNIVSTYIKKIKPSVIWDLGANDGLFSRITACLGIKTIAFDIDPMCVEINYLKSKFEKDQNILPLLIDITNPTPAIGWDNKERLSLQERGPADCVMALAFIHHLAIANNLPLDKIASFFSKICSNLIIEFIPKNDSQVQTLLAGRFDIFPDYSQLNFEKIFKKYFIIIEKASIKNSERTLYRMKV